MVKKGKRAVQAERMVVYPAGKRGRSNSAKMGKARGNGTVILPLRGGKALGEGSLVNLFPKPRSGWKGENLGEIRKARRKGVKKLEAKREATDYSKEKKPIF